VGGAFAICDNSDGNDLPEARTSRLLVINAMGRVRVAVDSDNNGIPNKDDGTDLASCINP
jgi:type IV fimbrial biogenesis protein FimT